MNKLLLFSMLLLVTCRSYAAPDSFSEALQAGADDVVAQSYNDAREDYREAEKLATTDADKQTVELLLGNVDLAERKYADARTRFTRILEMPHLLPDNKFQVWVFIGMSYMAEAKYDKARAAFDQALAVTNVLKSRWTAQQQKGLAFLLDKKYVQSREEFEKLRAYRSAIPFIDIVVNLFIGKSYLSEGNFEAARAQFVKVLEVKEEGTILGNIKDLKPSIKNVVRQYKQQARLGVAECYLKENNLTRAKEEYNKVLGMEKVDPIRKAEAEKQLRAIDELEKQAGEKK